MKFKESLKKYGCLPVATGLASVGLAVPAFAEGAAPTVVTASDWSSVISALTAQISVSTIIAALNEIQTTDEKFSVTAVNK